VRSINVLEGESGTRLAGILDAEPAGAGFRLRRLPAWTRQQILDPSLAFVATMPSGARLELSTDSNSIEVDAMLTMLQYGDQERRPSVFDLVVNGEVVAHQSFDQGRVIRIDPLTQAMTVERGPAVSIRFDGLPAGDKQVELWLAQGAAFELRDVRVDDQAQVRAPRPHAGPRWVHYGSSISHCVEADHPTGTWPVVAARRADADLISLGLAGQCHLDQWVARTIRDLDVDVISLKLGINVVNGDTMRERVFLSAAQGFLDTVRDGHPDTPIAVITPIICPVAEDHPGPTLSKPGGRVFVWDRAPEMSVGALSLVRIRRLLSDVVGARRRAGDANIHLVDGLSLFGPGDVEDLPDGLHPNSAGYQRMGERFHQLAFAPGGVFQPTS
jgi:lysophospholipase L1-like esterase